MLVGCSNKPSVVGKWDGPVPVMNTTVPGQFEFRGDKTYEMSMEQNGAKISMSGTYEFTDGSLTTTVSDVKLVSELPPQVKSMAEAQLATIKGQKSTGKVVFDGADKFSWDMGQGVTANLTRVKG